MGVLMMLFIMPLFDVTTFDEPETLMEGGLQLVEEAYLAANDTQSPGFLAALDAYVNKTEGMYWVQVRVRGGEAWGARRVVSIAPDTTGWTWKIRKPYASCAMLARPWRRLARKETCKPCTRRALLPNVLKGARYACRVVWRNGLADPELFACEYSQSAVCSFFFCCRLLSRSSPLRATLLVETR